MKKTIIVSLLMLTIIVGGLRALIYAQASSIRSQLIGTWRLVSATQKLADGTVRPDPQTGSNGVGYLIYTQDGHMCALVGNPERRKWESAKAPTDVELRNAFEGLVAYAGTFEVSEAEAYIMHHVEVDRVPNLSDTERKRFYSFTGNRLILRPAPPLPAEVKEWTIIWERVTK